MKDSPPRARSAVTEIEYRTRWLLRFVDGLPPETLREELEAIAAAARRTADGEPDALRAAIDRARAWLDGDGGSGPARPHLTLVRSPSEPPEGT